MLPGFNDAHAHVVYYGLTRFGADLGGARSVAEIVGAPEGPRANAQARRLAAGHGLPGRRARRARGSRTAASWTAGPAGGPLSSTSAAATARVANTRRARGGGHHVRDEESAMAAGSAAIPTARRTACCSNRRCGWSPTCSRRRAWSAASRASSWRRSCCSRGASPRSARPSIAASPTTCARTSGSPRPAGCVMRVNEFLSWELLEAASGLGRSRGLRRFARAGRSDQGVRRRRRRAGRDALRRRNVADDPGRAARAVSRATSAGLQVAAHAIGDARHRGDVRRGRSGRRRSSYAPPGRALHDLPAGPSGPAGQAAAWSP